MKKKVVEVDRHSVGAPSWRELREAAIAAGQVDLEEVIRAKSMRGPTVGSAVHVGREEIVNPVPVAPPVGFRRQPSMVDIVRDMVRSERLRQEVQAAGMETFEEADDFDVGDDFDPSSPYEVDFDPVPASELRRRRDVADLEAARLANQDSELEGSQGRPEAVAKPAKPLDGPEAPVGSDQPATPSRASQAPSKAPKGPPKS